jgi:two-component system, NarL family, nitrate/nitrite response regulator NarL
MNSLQEAGLSRREIQVLRLVAEGRPNKVIARELGITEQTVKFHMNNVFRKLSLTNRTEAARWAIGQGLVGTSSSGRPTNG